MKATKVVLMFILVLNTFLWLKSERRNERLEAENVALKAEKAEWQRAAEPAISAREWWSQTGAVQRTDNITPNILKYALSPCYTTPSGNYDSFNRDCIQMLPPIRIVFAERRP